MSKYQLPQVRYKASDHEHYIYLNEELSTNLLYGCFFLKYGNVGWLLQKRFVDLLGIYSLHINGRNLPIPFCLLTCRKQKLVQSKMLQQGIFVLILSCNFRQVFIHYLMPVLIVYK